MAGSEHELIYKVCRRAEWQQACEVSAYEGSADDRRDGFIHFSTWSQLAGTLAKHFKGQDDLVLIAFHADRLGPNLKWEPSHGGELFPHLYGALDPGLAMEHWPVPLDAQGIPQPPPEADITAPGARI